MIYRQLPHRDDANASLLDVSSRPSQCDNVRVLDSHRLTACRECDIVKVPARAERWVYPHYPHPGHQIWTILHLAQYRCCVKFPKWLAALCQAQDIEQLQTVAIVLPVSASHHLDASGHFVADLEDESWKTVCHSIHGRDWVLTVVLQCQLPSGSIVWIFCSRLCLHLMQAGPAQTLPACLGCPSKRDHLCDLPWQLRSGCPRCASCLPTLLP